MSVFDGYARYYDLLNTSKDYAGEAKYLHGLIQRFAPKAENILELGCGTGMHAVELANFGYRIHGVDRSKEMLARAEKRWSELSEESAARLTQSEADIRNLDLPRKFDVVAALFHVISYLPTNADLQAAFQVVRKHLGENGVFIFDCWYGPGVLTDRPAVRVREWEDEATGILRIAEPTTYPNENLVDVNYRICVHDKLSGKVESLTETHRMRYLFKPELEFLLEQAGLKMLYFSEWGNERNAGFDTWSAAVVSMALEDI